jgi:hypothetical protein
MPYQLGVTIRAPVIPERVAELREWLAEAGRGGIAGAPFDFALLRGVHFARLFLMPDGAGDDAASLVYMADVDGPLRRHLSGLVQVTGGGLMTYSTWPACCSVTPARRGSGSA